MGIFDLSVRDDLGKVAPSCILDLDADEEGKRIKCVSYGGPSQRMGFHYLVTGSSEGVVTVWLVNVAGSVVEKGDNVRKLAKATAGCRLTACDVSNNEAEDDEVTPAPVRISERTREKTRTAGLKRKASQKQQPQEEAELRVTKQKQTKKAEPEKEKGKTEPKAKKRFALIKKKMKRTISSS